MFNISNCILSTCALYLVVAVANGAPPSIQNLKDALCLPDKHHKCIEGNAMCYGDDSYCDATGVVPCFKNMTKEVINSFCSVSKENRSSTRRKLCNCACCNILLNTCLADLQNVSQSDCSSTSPPEKLNDVFNKSHVCETSSEKTWKSWLLELSVPLNILLLIVVLANFRDIWKNVRQFFKDRRMWKSVRQFFKDRRMYHATLTTDNHPKDDPIVLTSFKVHTPVHDEEKFPSANQKQQESQSPLNGSNNQESSTDLHTHFIVPPPSWKDLTNAECPEETPYKCLGANGMCYGYESYCSQTSHSVESCFHEKGEDLFKWCRDSITDPSRIFNEQCRYACLSKFSRLLQNTSADLHSKVPTLSLNVITDAQCPDTAPYKCLEANGMCFGFDSYCSTKSRSVESCFPGNKEGEELLNWCRDTLKEPSLLFNNQCTFACHSKFGSDLNISPLESDKDYYFSAFWVVLSLLIVILAGMVIFYIIKRKLIQKRLTKYIPCRKKGVSRQHENDISRTGSNASTRKEPESSYENVNHQNAAREAAAEEESTSVLAIPASVEQQSFDSNVTIRNIQALADITCPPTDLTQLDNAVDASNPPEAQPLLGNSENENVSRSRSISSNSSMESELPSTSSFSSRESGSARGQGSQNATRLGQATSDRESDQTESSSYNLMSFHTNEQLREDQHCTRMVTSSSSYE